MKVFSLFVETVEVRILQPWPWFCSHSRENLECNQEASETCSHGCDFAAIAVETWSAKGSSKDLQPWLWVHN